MGTKHLIDSNAVIEFLGGTLPSAGSDWMQNICDQNLQYLSVINKIEVLGFNGSPSELLVFSEFIQAAQVIPLSEAVVQQTIEIRKIYKIKLSVAIIAATAMVHDLTLITRNTSDFYPIQQLPCINVHHF